MLTLFKSPQHFHTLPSECVVVLRLIGRPGHRDLRTSSKFAQLKHHSPASAEGVVLSMDERCVFVHFENFRLGIVVSDFLCLFQILEIAAYPTIYRVLFVEYYWTFRQVRE